MTDENKDKIETRTSNPEEKSTSNSREKSTSNPEENNESQKKSERIDKKTKINLENHNINEFRNSNTYRYLIGKRAKTILNELYGGYYNLLHTIFIMFIGYLICFVNNLSHLVIGLLVISLDAHSNIVLHDCPLSMMENKYLEKSGIETRLDFLRSLGLMYSTNNKYDIQLEVIINAWCLVAGKILFLICFKNFTNRSFVN